MPFLLILTFLLTPAYAARFSVFGLPTDVLMVWVGVFWIAAIAWFTTRKLWGEFFAFLKTFERPILLPILLFSLAGVFALDVHGFDLKKTGQFLVLFLQPVSVFFISSFIFRKTPKAKHTFLTACSILLAVMGLFAILQYFTRIGLPAAYWGNSIEPKRALGFFGHPNFYALFAAPLLALLLPDVRLKLQEARKHSAPIIMWVIGVVGLLLSLSRAGWLGLGVTVLLYAIIAGDKRIRSGLGIIALVGILIVSLNTNLRWRILLPLHGEKSAVSRISLWNTGWKGVKEAPISGLGLAGFSRQWPILNTDPNLDTHNYPHNIFLDVWVETGLLGLISFIWLLGVFLWRGYSNRNDLWKFSVALFLTALLVQGQVDNPYFKNDLAMVFWMMLALAV